MVRTEEKPVAVFLRLLPSEVAKLDAIAQRIRANSRNHAVSILINSIEDYQAANIEVALPVTEAQKN